MRRFSLIAALLSGCLSHSQHVAVDGAVLGRVVIYRNGVAFYERHATIVNGQLAVHVPRDRVDDFLKSLTVVDPVTRAPLSVSIPRKEADDGSYLTMTIETPTSQRADVLLTYVTEAPAWKPSYRVVVGADGKVMLEGWAIVDNVSGEDWKDVLVGVGASSALAFRYDLWSVRRIDRDLLAGEEKFAVAPPTGVSPYEEGGEEMVALDGDEVRASQTDGRGVSFSGSTSLENQVVLSGVPTKGNAISGIVSDKKTGEKLAGVTVIATRGNFNQTAITDENGAYYIPLAAGDYQLTFYYADATAAVPNVHVAQDKTTQVQQRIDTAAAGGEVITVAGRAPMIDQGSMSQGVTITQDYTRSIPVPGRVFETTLGSAAGSQEDTAGYAPKPPPPPPPPQQQGDAKLHTAAMKLVQAKKDIVIETHALNQLDAAKRAQAVRDRLVDEGVPAAKIHVVPKIGPGESPRVRILALAPGAKLEPAAPAAHTRIPGGDEPVGESHFMADRPMNVRAGTSAMVAMVHGETTGGIVYLYDPVSDRGDQRFAFKAVRLDNPTADTLEPGPVTVYGDGRFIGEGVTEPVPPKASVVVPFALDKQILVERTDDATDRIAKLVTAQRGIVTAEMQHRKKTQLALTSRLRTPAKVYLRHKLESGWTVTEAPPRAMKVGDSQLYEVDLGPGETKHVMIAEETPIEKTFDLTSDTALGMMQVYVEDGEASSQLKEQITALLATRRQSADLEAQIETWRDQLGEYRMRAGELHAQLVTLKAVKTGGDLMSALKAKLGETQDRMQKTTLSIVDAQEKLMLARFKLQNQLADLHLGAEVAHAKR